MLENLITKMPQNNIIALVIALNILCYGAFIFWPQKEFHSYLNQFTFSLYGLNKGYFYNLLTCHFAHQSFLSFLLDSVILGLLSQGVINMHGPLFLAKTVLMSLFLGSFFLFAYHNAKRGMAHPY